MTHSSIIGCNQQGRIQDFVERGGHISEKEKEKLNAMPIELKGGGGSRRANPI